MFVITEAHIKDKANESLMGNELDELCLLIMFATPASKFISRNFIYEKLNKWGLINFGEEKKLFFLIDISKILIKLQEDELVEEKNLHQLNEREFNRFCTHNVLGAVSTCKKHRTQSVYKISLKGRKKVKKMFPLETMQRGCDRCARASKIA